MKLCWHVKAWDEYVAWQSEDRKTLKKINKLIKDMLCDPFKGFGKPEPLVGDLQGFWSRHIDDANRIVYKFEKDELTIIQCGTHYKDK